MDLLYTFWIMTSSLSTVVTQSSSIHIGGLFEPPDESQFHAFQYAVSRINADTHMLPWADIETDVRYVSTDSFFTSKQVCQQVRPGVAAIFGPMSMTSGAHVQSVCERLEVPHIETRWDYHEKLDSFSVNLYPEYKTLSKAYMDLITHMQWTTFTMLYIHENGLIRLQELFTMPSNTSYDMTVREFHADETGDYREALRMLKANEEYNLIVDCDASEAYEILRQALTVGMMTSEYHYIFTSLDLHTIDLTDFRYGGANITGFRLVNPSHRDVYDIREDWKRYKETEEPNTHWIVQEHMDKGLTTSAALLYDAVHLLSRSLQQLAQAQNVATTPLACGGTSTWRQGSSLLNYIKMTSVSGVTGMLRFDNSGKRTAFSLDVISISEIGLRKVAEWNSLDGMSQTVATEDQDKIPKVEEKSTLIVTTIEERPYMIRKRDKSLTGNDRFEGYCVDLLDLISEYMHINFTIKPVADSKYGAPIDNTEQVWNGMVGELMRGEADIAVASLTISYARQKVIDFTKPFMNLGISIIFKKPEPTNSSLFSFLKPLSIEIWLYVMVAYTGVSFMLYAVGRFTPYEWYDTDVCYAHPTEEVENTFTLMNSLWFSIGSLMQQGSEIAPRAISTRMIGGLWWFFTLIIIASYTANLAAFLTVERMISPIESAEDLARQSKIKYGTIQGGSTMLFFQQSSISTFKKMGDYMRKNPEVFVNSTSHGLARVSDGSYAFLLESTMNEYFTQRECKLMQVGGLLDSKGYGIGTAKGSPYRDEISNVILKLQETQKLQILYDRWWKQKGARQCGAEEKGQKAATSLTIDNVAGVFVVLLIGLFVSLFVALTEFLWKAKQDAKHDRRSLCFELGRECKFAMHCFGSSQKELKPVEPQPDPSTVREAIYAQPTPTRNNVSGSNNVNNTNRNNVTPDRKHVTYSPLTMIGN